RLGAGHREAHHFRGRDELRDQLSPADLELVASAQMRAARRLLLNGAHDGRMTVTEEERAVPHPIVDVFVAVHVPLERALRAIHVDREWPEMPAVVRDAAGNDTARALEQGERFRVERVVRVEHRGCRRHWIEPPVVEGAEKSFNSSSMPMCAAKGKPSTVTSRRRVKPSTAPAATQASTIRRSSSAECRSSRPPRRESSATTPQAPQFDVPATTRGRTFTPEVIAGHPARVLRIRDRTFPMPISFPPSPIPTVTTRRGAARNRASSGGFQSLTDTPRAFR